MRSFNDNDLTHWNHCTCAVRYLTIVMLVSLRNVYSHNVSLKFKILMTFIGTIPLHVCVQKADIIRDVVQLD